MGNPFEEKIAQLLSGECSELVVEKDDFFTFREAWLAHPERKKIIGEAHLGGKVIYRREEDDVEN